ncbi:uncharacterized protein ACR2FA_008122 [Aphomia sociella]
MFSSLQLKKFLEKISENAKFVKYDYVSAEKFSIHMRCKAATDQSQDYYNQYVSTWIRKFSNYTTTNWIVRNTFPKVKRLVYRKVFTCRRSAFNKSRTAERTLNVECKAKIDFKIKFINRHTIRNDPYLNDGLNVTIFINFIHSHKVRARESFNLLKSSTETDQVFYELFDKGYNPTMAKLYNELTIIDKYGIGSDVLMAANRNPSMYHINYIYKKRKTDTSSQTFEEIMAMKKETITKLGGMICYDNPQVIIVVTPLMKRVIMESSLDIVAVDSITTNVHVSFMYVPSKVGLLPIACILHAEQSEASYNQAFFAVKLLLEDECGKTFEPKILFANDLENEKSALEAIYKSSKVLVSTFSICCDVWQWICKDTNKIDRKKRHNIMLMFDSMFRADSMEDAKKWFNILREDEYVNDTPILRDYVIEIWNRCEHWFMDREKVKHKLIDLSARVINEFVVSKCKQFNICVMVDVVVNILENHFRQILLAHIKEESIFETYTKLLRKCQTISELDIKRISANEYRLQPESTMSKIKYIKFRTDTWCCDCISGKLGRFCEHLSLIINTMETNPKIPDLSEDDKIRFTKIAGGDIEDDKIVKLEDSEDCEAVYKDDQENFDENIENDEFDNQSIASIKSINNVDGYYYEDIKIEKTERCDPLDDDSHNNDQDIAENSEIETADGQSELHNNYEKALRSMNEEFRRLNKHFKENPNASNMNTMERLAKELRKIRPVERVSFANMSIELNSNKKKRTHDDD